ncbi:hypothetical protein MP228_010499 [Amoeboaphelidium protococcarum]|nr:hypothetical protein MP228_010499 [Amoeboaphelidium protococcarum]
MAPVKEYSADEVAMHQAKTDIWFTVHNQVYNVTKFLDEHPGGEEVLLEHAGQDATEAFEDVGHSEDAREQLKDYLVGSLKTSDGAVKSPNTQVNKSSASSSNSNKGGHQQQADGMFYVRLFVPLVLIAAVMIKVLYK